MNLLKPFLLIPTLFIMACSAAYEQVKNINIDNPKTFQEHLLYNYKQKATFEAEKMHDWNSAKLYSEKALRALDGEKIYPEKITNWKIASDKTKDIRSSYDNLLLIYEDAINIDPQNLAKAISSLDCWSEQEEEKWQTWDIEKCKNDFHSAMHEIYNKISNDNKNILLKEIKEKEKSDNNVAVVTKNNKKEIMQIIYFDFDDSELSEISKITLKLFLKKYKNKLSRYIILGHTDTKGTNEYNLNLSNKRADIVKDMLLNEGIPEKDISILGKGENELAVITPDDTRHPANRRAEVKIIN